MGYLPFNVGAAIRGPKLEHTLAERILSEQQDMQDFGESSGPSTPNAGG
jgi:hypothetical protein